MATVLQMSKKLAVQPPNAAHSRILVRIFSGGCDIEPWLELRHRAFAKERVGVRQWTSADFQSEFLDRWWWRPEWMWLAEAPAAEARKPGLIGAVTLAMRGNPDSALPVVHWLMVLPRWRQQGIGQLLMAHLETAAWKAGHREIWLETHAAWEPAARFYRAQGFREENHQ